MIKIGKTELEYGVMLAPMAGVTDHAMRIFCKRYGAEYTVSEMISAKAIHYKDKKTDILSAVTEAESPIAIQIFGREPDIMAEGAQVLECRGGIAAIDINMGCPAHKIVGNGEGSSLMREPERVYEIVRAVKSAVSLPVTVKIRSGWDSGSINAPHIAEIIEKGGADAICVHGRTREQMYKPPVDLCTIAEVKRAVSIPVIGNGGIMNAEGAVEMFEKTGCDGIMIAQGACGNPWIFKEIISKIKGEAYQAPSACERLDIALEHVHMLVSDKGEYTGIREARKHLSWYVRGMEGSSEFRGRINSALSEAEMAELLTHLKEINS